MPPSSIRHVTNLSTATSQQACWHALTLSQRYFFIPYKGNQWNDSNIPGTATTLMISWCTDRTRRTRFATLICYEYTECFVASMHIHTGSCWWWFSLGTMQDCFLPAVRTTCYIQNRIIQEQVRVPNSDPALSHLYMHCIALHCIVENIPYLPKQPCMECSTSNVFTVLPNAMQYQIHKHPHSLLVLQLFVLTATNHIPSTRSPSTDHCPCP